jgi:hypothetical protein
MVEADKCGWLVAHGGGERPANFNKRLNNTVIVMKELIIKIIRRINKEKDEAMRRPVSATENEVRAELSREVTAALNELISEGKVKVDGVSINKVKLFSV